MADTPPEGRSHEGEPKSDADVRYSRTQNGDRVELAYELSEGLEGLAPGEMFATQLVMETQTAVVVNRDLERTFSLTVEAGVSDLVHERVQAALANELGGELTFEEVPPPIQVN